MRASTEADVARCAQIYGHHVLHGTASFEEERSWQVDGIEPKQMRGTPIAE